MEFKIVLNEMPQWNLEKKELVSSKTTKDYFKSAHQNQQQVLIFKRNPILLITNTALSVFPSRLVTHLVKQAKCH